jgi:hypothetical protein
VLVLTIRALFYHYNASFDHGLWIWPFFPFLLCTHMM